MNALFPQGYRKLLFSLIALAIGFGIEKFGGGLSDNMEQSLIAIVAIFVTGNVGEHLSKALAVLRGTKIGQIIEDVVPGDQGLGENSQFAEAPLEEEDPYEMRFKELENKLTVQAQNMGQVVQILNAMRGTQPANQYQNPPKGNV